MDFSTKMLIREVHTKNNQTDYSESTFVQRSSKASCGMWLIYYSIASNIISMIISMFGWQLIIIK